MNYFKEAWLIVTKKDKYRSPKFYEGVEDPELIDWDEDSEDGARYDDEEQRCFPFPALVIATGAAAASCNPRLCNPNCNPRFCNPNCNPNCNPRLCNPNCNPRFCNPNCNPRLCNPNFVSNIWACNPNSCRPRPQFCRPGSCMPQ